MQLSYNNQSLLATGCYENEDPGITRMGKQVIGEMNRVGMVVDMSHSAERSTLEAIEISERPIAITHANPSFWHPALRNKSECTLESFCEMVARTAELMGADQIGFGSDLCQDQPDSVVEWMRNGTWTRERDYGEGSAGQAGFPEQPSWFRDNRDYPKILIGLKEVGFSDEEIEGISGKNWLHFFEESFGALKPNA